MIKLSTAVPLVLHAYINTEAIATTIICFNFIIYLLNLRAQFTIFIPL